MAKRKNYKASVGFISILFFVLLVIGVSIGLFKVFLNKYPYFIIQTLTLEGDKELCSKLHSYLGKKLLGENIFYIKLESLKKQIEEELANVECRSIERKFPNEVVISLALRVPVAQLKLLRFYPVDSTGMIIGNPSDLAFGNIPVILGIEDKIQKPKIAKTYSFFELKLALNLIREKNSIKDLDNYRLTKVSFTKTGDVSFFIIDNSNDSFKDKIAASISQIEIKFDPQELNKTLRVLGLILGKQHSSLENIEYIDLKNPSTPVFMEKKKNKQQEKKTLS